MADTADLRSEGKKSETKSAKNSANRRQRLKCLGLCTICGVTKISGARTASCYECSAEQARRTYKSGARHFLRLVGVDFQTAETMSEDQIKQLLSLVRSQ